MLSELYGDLLGLSGAVRDWLGTGWDCLELSGDWLRLSGAVWDCLGTGWDSLELSGDWLRLSGAVWGLAGRESMSPAQRETRGGTGAGRGRS